MFLAALAIAGIASDVWFTLRRLKMSPTLEANPFVRYLAARGSAEEAVWLGVAVPQTILTMVAALTTPTGFAMLVGGMMYRLLIQCQSLELERQIRAGLRV